MASERDDAFSQVIIIGGGLSGLTMACQLKRQLNCQDVAIYDRAPRLGGTWYANRYPGCGVDIPAAFYSLSFAPKPEFSRFFPKQEEILRYIEDVAQKFNVTERFVGNTEWEGASWQDDVHSWSVRLRDTSTGRRFTRQCKVLVSAVGGLTNPNNFNMPGIDTFTGDIVHTARWDPNVSLAEKNVIVVGNGSSATQLVPAIAEEVKHITQFIRTPQYYMPSQNNTISTFWRIVFRYVPGSLQIFRALIFLYLESSILQFSLTWLGAKMRKMASENCKQYIMKHAPAKGLTTMHEPEEYWPLLNPGYELGCKRRVFDNDGYLACLQRPNVHVTDDPIVRFLEHSALTKSGRMYSADVVVLATGFSPSQHDVDLLGRNGISRQEYWKEKGSMRAFNTVAMSGFPNFFYILGPNSGRGHTSTVFTIESYVNLIIRVIGPVLTNRALSVEVKLSSEEAFNDNLERALNGTVFTDTCRSWYIDPKTEKNWFIYPWSSLSMWYSTHWSGMGDWTYEPRDPPSFSRKEDSSSLQGLKDAFALRSNIAAPLFPLFALIAMLLVMRS